MPATRSISQRRSRACEECVRRKIRCGPERPCQPCLQRGIGRFCDVPLIFNSSYTLDHTSEPRPKIRSPMKDALDLDVALLHERIAGLEEQLARERQRSINIPTDAIRRTKLPFDTITYETEELDSSMEHLNLGIAYEESASEDNVTSAVSSVACSHVFALPSRHTSTEIIRYSMQHLGWLHCAVNSIQFLAEHEAFWDVISAKNSRAQPSYDFLAKYSAILSIGIYYMDNQHEIIRNFRFDDSESIRLVAPKSRQDLANLSRHWYWASLQALEDSDFLVSPKLSTVQVVAILTLVNSSFGQNNREWMLIGMAISMARSLQMHRLAREETISPNIKSLPHWQSLQDRTLGRCLWWTLVICDWMGFMSHRPMISPHSFNTELETNSDQSDFVSLAPAEDRTSSNIPSSLEYHGMMARLAQILRTYVKSGRSYAPQNLILAIKEIEKLDSESPSHLKNPTNSTMECPELGWISFQRYLAVHAIQFSRLTVARYFFTGWIKRRPDPEGLHVKACRAAEIIVAEKLRPVPSVYKRSWIVSAATIAAGVFLCLDILFFSTGETTDRIRNRQSSVKVCIEALNDIGSTSILTQRGTAVLQTLLDIQANWPATTVPNDDSLRQVIEQVVKIQKLYISKHSKWSRPARIDWKRKPGSQVCDQRSCFGLPVSNDRGAVPKRDYRASNVGVGVLQPSQKEELQRTQWGQTQQGWDFLMDGGGCVSSNRDMELDELMEFDNPFQFSETFYNMA